MNKKLIAHLILNAAVCCLIGILIAKADNLKHALAVSMVLITWFSLWPGKK